MVDGVAHVALEESETSISHRDSYMRRDANGKALPSSILN